MEPTVPDLITGRNGLKYCCLFAFFSLFRRTSQIALRLGVSRQAVAKYKRRYREGCYSCQRKENCLRVKLLKEP